MPVTKALSTNGGSMKSQKVLDDTWISLSLMEKASNDEELRVYWVSTICLLRMIGHVLHKVDSKLSITHKAVIDKWWSEINQNKPEPTIFWTFINESRNLVLKEYELNFITYKCEWIDTDSEGKIDVIDDTIHITPDGHELFEQLSDALLWWQAELSSINRLAQKGT